MGVLEEKLAAAQAPRTVHVFVVPDSVPGEVRSVGLKELTAAEELMATKRAGMEPVRIAYERIVQALVEVHGAAVSVADGTADRAWAGMHPQVRDLIVVAYGDIHTPKEDAVEAFRRSRVVKVA